MTARRQLARSTILLLSMATSVGICAPLPLKEPKERAVLADTSGPIAFSPDGKTLVSSDWGKTARLSDVATGKETGRLGGPSENGDGAAFSADGKLLATSGRDRRLAATGRDGIIKLWDVAERKSVATFVAESSLIYALVFSKDSKFLASGADTGDGALVEIWDLERKTVCSKQKVGRISGGCLVYTPEGKLLAACFSDKAPSVEVWDVFAGKVIATLDKDSPPAYGVAFSPDCKILATTVKEYKTLRLWDIASGKMIAAFTYDDLISSAAFRPDGKLLAVGHTSAFPKGPGQVRLIDLTTNKVVADFQVTTRPVPTGGMVFSPDGNVLAASSRLQVALWDIPAVISPK